MVNYISSPKYMANLSNNCCIILFLPSLLEEKILANISCLCVNNILSQFVIPLVICNITFSMICLQKYVSFLKSFKVLALYQYLLFFSRWLFGPFGPYLTLWNDPKILPLYATYMLVHKIQMFVLYPIKNIKK